MMIRRSTYFLGLTGLLMLLIISGCGRDDPERIAKKDREKILEYIKKENINATEHDSGLFYEITREGTGDHPNLYSKVSIAYTGYFLDGKIFDASFYYENFLYNTIQGWQVGVPLFKRGGKGKLIVPSGMGYGINPYPGIPANSILVFDIELFDFN